MPHLRRLLVLVALGLPLSAQDGRIWDQNTNMWLTYVGDHPVSDRWGLHLEGQLRRDDGPLKPQQLLVRPAVNYRLTDSISVTAGYAFVDTYRYGDFPAPARFPEHRLFEQVVLSHQAGRAGLQHRYRLEQRYIGRTSPRSQGPRLEEWRYRNRFRYMLRGTIPFLRTSPWYVAASNEIFVSFGGDSAASVFGQNRVYVGLGRRLEKLGAMEIGYLNQILQQRGGAVFQSNHTIQMGWSSQLRFR